MQHILIQSLLFFFVIQDLALAYTADCAKLNRHVCNESMCEEPCGRCTNEFLSPVEKSSHIDCYEKDPVCDPIETCSGKGHCQFYGKCFCSLSNYGYNCQLFASTTDGMTETTFAVILIFSLLFFYIYAWGCYFVYNKAVYDSSFEFPQSGFSTSQPWNRSQPKSNTSSMDFNAKITIESKDQKVALKQEYKKPLQNWEEKTDPRNGRKYYVNHTTKKTHWELPKGVHVWEKGKDPQNNKPYYIDHNTRRTTWTKPIGVTFTSATIMKKEQVPNAKSEWEERTDVQSGKKYYINHKTQTTSWVKPAGVSFPSTAASTDTANTDDENFSL